MQVLVFSNNVLSLFQSVMNELLVLHSLLCADSIVNGIVVTCLLSIATGFCHF